MSTQRLTPAPDPQALAKQSALAQAANRSSKLRQTKLAKLVAKAKADAAR